MTLFVAIAILAAGAWFVTGRDATPEPQTNPEGKPSQVGPSTPPPPIVKATYDNATEDMIVVTTPLPGATSSRIVEVEGRARGNWYFEANFPIEIQSPEGDVLVRIGVQAKGPWMTTEFVPFSASLTLPPNYHGPATLILRNDNASGLPEYDRSVSIPIVVQ